ncbi:hypothetical protein [Edaphobacter flagellatus]|uniref:hypothetical protein n=1 Tax=Edaphobacter flagellatus TaxID=1933044 RepID=UPI0021B1B90B|nr:hypothetical protein [Edaphobacter flagellatus]
MSETVDIDWNPEAPIVDPYHADEYFIELCSLASTGTLTPAEWRQLETHLGLCASCRAIKAEYDRVVSTTLPAMAANRRDADHGDSPDPWSPEKAEAALFERIEQEGVEPEKLDSAPEKPHHLGLLAIAAVSIVACSFVGYRLGFEHGRFVTMSMPQERTVAIVRAAVLEEKKVSAPVERSEERITVKVDQLQRRLDTSSSTNEMLKDQRLSLLSELQERDGILRQTEQERADLEKRLSVSQASTQSLQAKLDAEKASLDVLPSTDILQKRVDDLTAKLEEKKQQIVQEEELLEHDRDIRNLMGARDLYIGEIYDVAKSGKTQKPFGRVFYTQGRSLVFYAYDLDQQPGVKHASTFQAWGRRGVDQEHDVSLGVFYQDDQNKKRWVLKSNDSAMLSQLDAVFVTVESHGTSSRPTSKPLLFTYLKLPPNHP